MGRGGGPGSSGSGTGFQVTVPLSTRGGPHRGCLLPATLQLGFAGSCTDSHVYKVSFPSEPPPSAEFSCFTPVLRTGVCSCPYIGYCSEFLRILDCRVRLLQPNAQLSTLSPCCAHRGLDFLSIFSEKECRAGRDPRSHSKP